MTTRLGPGLWRPETTDTRVLWPGSDRDVPVHQAVPDLRPSARLLGWDQESLEVARKRGQAAANGRGRGA